MPTETMKHAIRLSTFHDNKPINRMSENAIIGVNPCGAKFFVNNQRMIPIIRFYKCNNEFIVNTACQIYIIPTNIPCKKIIP